MNEPSPPAAPPGRGWVRAGLDAVAGVVRRIGVQLAVLVAKALSGGFWLLRHGGWRALTWSFRRGPVLLLILAAVYALLVLRAAATLSNLLWVGNGLFALAMATVGLVGLIGTLGRERMRSVAGSFEDSAGKEAPTELYVVAPDGSRRARVFLSRAMYVVGRGPECDVRIQEPNVSRRHCCIVRRGGRYRVEELGSTYGTMLNGRKLPAEGVDLQRGDVIEFTSTATSTVRLLVGPTGDTAEESGADGPS